MSDHRARPRIHRCDDAHDAKIRAYAREHGIEPWQALELAIEGLDELAQAREQEARTEAALRRKAERAANKATVERDRAQTAQANTEALLATALSRSSLDPDLMARVQARITSRPGRDFAFVLENGCSRLEASDDYQDRKKAARAAKKGA